MLFTYYRSNIQSFNTQIATRQCRCRIMQPLNKALITAKVEGKKWQQEPNRFLLQFRSTPHTVTKVPPAELLFKRTVRGTLPGLKIHKMVNRHKQAVENEKERTAYNKSYADTHCIANKNEIQIGDSVLVLQEKKHKLMPKFNAAPYTVTERKGVRITAKSNEGHRIACNVSHFKRIPVEIDEETSSDEEPVSESKLPENERSQHIRRSERNRKVPERYGHSLVD